MIPRPIDALTCDDVQALIRHQTPEGRTLEYKRQLPGDSQNEKVGLLLKPLCSFANSDGGDLVYGVEEKDGIASAVHGVEITDFDELQLRLEGIIQTGIEPQLRGHQISQPIEVSSGHHVLVVRLPSRSWLAPHRVVHDRQFYARNAAGCYPLDVPQIRQAFLLSGSLQERLRAFRADRVSVLLGGTSPVPLRDGVRMVLHLVPLASLASPGAMTSADFSEVRPGLHKALLSSHISVDGDHYNFDGIVCSSGMQGGPQRSYWQLFRNGALEFVNVAQQGQDAHHISTKQYEGLLMTQLAEGLGIVGRMGFSAPVYVLLSVVGARGWRLDMKERVWHGDADDELRNLAFDREALLLPDLAVESLSQDPYDVMRPLFDMIWNAAGHPRSLNFDESGEWRHEP